MEIHLEEDESGRLLCAVRHASGESVLSAADLIAAGTELIGALDDVASEGYAECYWREPRGEYRWMFRLTADRLLVTALWSSGTLTGWEHVFQDETSLEQFDRQVRTGIVALGQA